MRRHSPCGARPNDDLTAMLALWLTSYVAGNIGDTASSAVFRALADPTRRQILYDLRKSPLAAGEIASRFPISGPSVSRHLAVLKSAGLVSERRQANKVIYSLVPDRLANSVGCFLSAVCSDKSARRRPGKKRSKAAEKSAGKGKRKGPAGSLSPARPTGTGSATAGQPTDDLSATV